MYWPFGLVVIHQLGNHQVWVRAPLCDFLLSYILSVIFSISPRLLPLQQRLVAVRAALASPTIHPASIARGLQSTQLVHPHGLQSTRLVHPCALQ